MTEEQFEVIELFFANEVRKLSNAESFSQDDDFVGTKELVLRLREKLKIHKKSNKLLFN